MTTRLGPTLAVIAAGGALGALARHGLLVAFPHRPTGFPWATFAINVSGCLLIGLLYAVVSRFHSLVRPFLGVGFLGGFTTFSAYAVDAQRAIDAGAPLLAFVYLSATLVCALVAVALGSRLGRLW